MIPYETTDLQYSQNMLFLHLSKLIILKITIISLNPTEQPCPKCHGLRKTSKLFLGGRGDSYGYVWVRLGGRIRNRDNRDLFAIVCEKCGFSEIYASK